MTQIPTWEDHETRHERCISPGELSYSLPLQVYLFELKQTWNPSTHIISYSSYVHNFLHYIPHPFLPPNLAYLEKQFDDPIVYLRYPTYNPSFFPFSKLENRFDISPNLSCHL
jgi:hypothetical protein